MLHPLTGSNSDAKTLPRVQVGKAEPVDRAVAGYERGGPTIADEGVLADRCVATLAGDTGTSSTAT